MKAYGDTWWTRPLNERESRRAGIIVMSVVGLVILIGLLAVVWAGVQASRSDRACEARGGMPVRHDICVDPAVLR